jgi:lysophospholipase L1-like esterase
LVGKEYELEKKKGVYRIFVLGDSVAAQGWSCTFLEDKLNNNISSHTFEIWNSGTGSYDVRRYALYLKHKGLKYKPDMVIVFFNMQDFWTDLSIYYKTSNGALAYNFPLSEISKRYVVSPFLLKHSFLYRFIILRLNSYLLNKKKISGDDSCRELGRYYLQMIKETCEKNKLSLFIAIFPYFKPLGEYKNYQLEEYRIINETIKDLKINHINLYDYLPIKDLKNLRDQKEDEIHPNREGHQIIADILYDYMINNFFKNKIYKNN